MTIAGGIFLIAVGAILKFATNVHVQGVSVDTVVPEERVERVPEERRDLPPRY